MRMPTADGRDLAMLLLFLLFCCALAGIITLLVLQQCNAPAKHEHTPAREWGCMRTTSEGEDQAESPYDLPLCHSRRQW